MDIEMAGPEKSLLAAGILKVLVHSGLNVKKGRYLT